RAGRRRLAIEIARAIETKADFRRNEHRIEILGRRIETHAVGREVAEAIELEHQTPRVRGVDRDGGHPQAADSHAAFDVKLMTLERRRVWRRREQHDANAGRAARNGRTDALGIVDAVERRAILLDRRSKARTAQRAVIDQVTHGGELTVTTVVA